MCGLSSSFCRVFDAVSAVVMVGRSVSVCPAFATLSIYLSRVSSDNGWKIRICVFAFVDLSLYGCGAVQVRERVNMAGAGEVKFLRGCAECPCCLLLSGFFRL